MGTSLTASPVGWDRRDGVRNGNDYSISLTQTLKFHTSGYNEELLLSGRAVEFEIPGRPKGLSFFHSYHIPLSHRVNATTTYYLK